MAAGVHLFTGGKRAIGRGSHLAGVATTSHPRYADHTTLGWWPDLMVGCRFAESYTTMG